MYERDGLTMRAVERNDLEPLRLMHNDPSTLGMLTDTTPVTPAMQEAWFDSLGGGRSRRYLIVDGAGERVALVRLDELDLVNRTVRVGLDVFVEKRRQGFGTRCYGLLLTYCFEELGLEMVWLWTAAFNVAARGLYAKLGFTETGRLPGALRRGGTRHDLVCYSLRSKTWQNR